MKPTPQSAQPTPAQREALDAEANSAARRVRQQEGELVRVLRTVEDMKLYFDYGLPDLFTYCTKRLRMSECQARLRIKAVKKVHEIPEILPALEDGRLTLSNLAGNDKAFLFLMDFANRQRIKVWGRARAVENDPELMEKLVDPGYRARPERAIVFAIEAWDVNCPQHIHRRFPQAQVGPVIDGLKARIADLEARLAQALAPNE